MSTGLIQKDVDQIVPIVLARAGYEKRLIENDNGGECLQYLLCSNLMFASIDDASFTNMIKILQDGIVSVRTGWSWNAEIPPLIINEPRKLFRPAMLA